MNRCLIVEGSPIIRKVASTILSDFGFEVVEAAGGREAILQFNRHIPVLALVDAGITDMSALDVLRHMRNAAGGKVHVLYSTTQFDVIEAQRASAAGASDLLVKPFDRHALAAKLKGWRGGDDGAGQEGFYGRLSRSEIVRIA
jgi:two-component system chemotaxis response regulator CheY